MSDNKLILLITAEQGYIHTAGDSENFSAQNDILFSAISDTYIPLLNMFCTLEEENIPFKVAITMSPLLCTLLADEQVQQQYINYLDRRIALGNEELERNKDRPEILEQVRSCLRKLLKDRLDFTETYSQNLLEKFRYFASKGLLEIVPTAATYAYLPHYQDLPEVLNAQIETGMRANRHFFGDAGEGFFLPHMGWSKGIDKRLRAYGMNYTVVDARALLFAGTPAEKGIFAPVRTNSSLVLFASDSTCPECILGDDGYQNNPAYRSQQKDIGFDLPSSALETFLGSDRTRIQTGFKYWCNDEDRDVPYDRQAALEQAKADAIDFYEQRQELLSKAGSEIPEGAILTCTIPAEVLGQTWHEGVYWLEQVIRTAASKNQVKLSLFRENLDKQFSLPKITPYPCAFSCGTGYAEDLLDSTNSWMMRYIRKASERMIDLTERFPSETGLKARLLNLGAREVLLAQSSDWPRMIKDGQIPDFVEESFKKNILSFTMVFDSLASNTVSTEWLTNLEKEHAVFPWINYRIFSRKK